MATIIPRAEITTRIDQAPQVRNTTRVDPSPAIDAAQGLNRVAQGYIAQKQEENDLTAVMQARRELSDWEAQTFDPANAEGISKFRGQNALGANEALIPDLDRRVGEISGRLTPRQRAQFEQVSTNFRDQLQGRLNNHMDREHSAYLSAEQKATLESLGQDAVAAAVAGDFGRQDAIANEVLSINRARRTTEGMGEELIKAEERGIVSTIRRQTVDSMMTTQPFQAQAYYERYADQMSPEDRAAVERNLFPIVNDVEAGATAASIIAGGDPGQPKEAGESVDAMIVGLESGGSDSAKNPNSSATGAGQFLDSTWLGVVKRNKPEMAKGKTDAEILALRKDGNLSREMVTAFREENSRALSARGVPTTAVNLYAAHHFGVGGASKFASLPDSAPMSKVLSSRELAANPYLKDKTVGDVKANWAKRGLKEGGGDNPLPAQAAPRSEADALAYANTIRDPRQRAAVTGKIKEHFQLEDMRRAEAEKAMSEHTYTSINQAANPALPLRVLIGAEAYGYYERKGQLGPLETMRKNKLLGTLTQDDPVLVDAYMREATLSPNTFMKRDLRDPKVVSRLSTDTLTSLLDMQKKAKDPTQRAEWASQQERIDSGLRILGIDDSKKAAGSGSTEANKSLTDQQAAYGLVYREAERALIQTLGGKKPTPEQLDALSRNVTRSVAENPWMLERNPDGSARAGSLEGYAAAMPDAVRQEAIRTYQAKYGAAAMPTEAQIVQYAVLKSKQAQ